MTIETTIKIALLHLPEWCAAEFPTHEWVNAYGDNLEHIATRHVVKDPVYQLPYQVCKHCHQRKA